MGRAKKVVLAYSGGVDTSVCIPYLKQEWGVEEVITFAADLGQGDELEPIRQKALDAGASQSLVGDLIQPFHRRLRVPSDSSECPLRRSLSLIHCFGSPFDCQTTGGGCPRGGC
jgi:argininosuccinate synthase